MSDWYTIRDRDGQEWLVTVSNRAAWLYAPAHWRVYDSGGLAYDIGTEARLVGGYRLVVSHWHAKILVWSHDYRMWRTGRHYRRRRRFIERQAGK